MSWGRQGSEGLDGQLGLGVFHVLSLFETLCGEPFMQIKTTINLSPALLLLLWWPRKARCLPAVMHGGFALPRSLQPPSLREPISCTRRCLPQQSFLPSSRKAKPESTSAAWLGGTGQPGELNTSHNEQSSRRSAEPGGWCHPWQGSLVSLENAYISASCF